MAFWGRRWWPGTPPLAEQAKYEKKGVLARTSFFMAPLSFIMKHIEPYTVP